MSKNRAYDEMVVEPWDVIIANFNPSAVRGYFIGETIAYLMRYNGLNNDERGSTKDLMKAKHFIERLIDYDNGLHLSGNEDRSQPGAVRGAWTEAQAMPWTTMNDDDDEGMSARVAADGVKALIEGRLSGPTLPGTLADRVYQWALRMRADSYSRGEQDALRASKRGFPVRR